MADLSRHEEYESYAAAVLRANALLGKPGADDQKAIDDVAEALTARGLTGELSRHLDDGGVVRWRLRIVTERGKIDLELDQPSDWKQELEEAGL